MAMELPIAKHSLGDEKDALMAPSSSRTMPTQKVVFDVLSMP